MEEIPFEANGLSRAIFSTLLNYPVPNCNGKIMLTIYRNKISKLTDIYGIMQNRSTERCSKLKRSIDMQIQERMVLTLEQMQVPNGT